ncbi:Ca2+-binding RTX toxin-like protein [Methylobacterium sp. BE186]|uniref:calcium-binding protein n=1 Tax=Methylobacterium sp. BE186 TaxID=2817715 RepID=UPI002866FE09|nr:hypothetical protein [Methylobacterium sp. BE186]MDR7035803.1 Ca2+-binding RTX toxin-like protein [Methylobacterium sp. BE186]
MATITGTNNGENLHGTDYADTIDAKGGNDTVHAMGGDAGNDKLYGDAGNDRIYGEAGDDRIEGGAGNDWLDGGSGSDMIYGGKGDTGYAKTAGVDQIHDFGATDKIYLEGNYKYGADADHLKVGEYGISGSGTDWHVSYNSGDGGVHDIHVTGDNPHGQVAFF